MLNCSPLCLPDATVTCRGQKRKRDEVTERESCDSLHLYNKRERSTVSNKRCQHCSCRLELAVREIGKCKCGSVFCLLHRLPEQHNCTYDHKEDGRREARAKMVPARKHVGTTLKRLDSDS
jgi:predicted nucleic acid binding AN1-type Zn finger protein